jgi:regulatory protein
MNKPVSDNQRIAGISRKDGGLRVIETSSGNRFLVVKSAKTEHLLKIGFLLQDRDIELLEGQFAKEGAMRLARSLLSRRDRSKWEIRNALVKVGIDNEGIINYTIGTLEEYGYLDDRRFASEFIIYRMKRRPSGPYFLKRKLLAVGIDSDIIEDEIDGFFIKGKEMDIAVDLVLKKFSPEMERKRLIRKVNGFLRLRGFRTEVVNGICARLARNEILTG